MIECNYKTEKCYQSKKTWQCILILTTDYLIINKDKVLMIKVVIWLLDNALSEDDFYILLICTNNAMHITDIEDQCPFDTFFSLYGSKQFLSFTCA